LLATFRFNVNPSPTELPVKDEFGLDTVWTKRHCMYAENFHGLASYRTFNVELICKHDYATQQSADLVAPDVRYIEEFIDTEPEPYTFT